MTLINLKFSPEMEELVLQGKKCCTTRDDVKGNPGDIFRVGNRIYRIVGIQTEDYEFIDRYYELDGFDSINEYLDAIDRIYPELNPEEDMYIHFFAYVGDWCPQFGVTGAACSNPEELCELYSDCVKVR